jgi:phosphomannomutase
LFYCSHTKALSPLASCLKPYQVDLPLAHAKKNVLKGVNDKITQSLEFDPIKQAEFLFKIYADKAVKIISINKTDGLRMSTNNNDTIHIMLSGNAPELRVYIQTSSMDKSEGLVDAVIAALKNTIFYEKVFEKNS